MGRMSELAMDVEEEREMLGHNEPPSPLEYAQEAMRDLNKFLTNNPVIQTPEQAKAGALWVERTRKTIGDIEDERKREVGPLNETVKLINERYRTVRDPLDGVLAELRRRLTDFAAREEAARFRAAEEARQLAEAAEIEARRAEAAEHEAKQNASFGEIVNVAAAIQGADDAFSEFERAKRAADLAQRDTHLRLPSQLGGKALGLRDKEILILDDAMLALSAVGNTADIRDAILKAARYYRKTRGKLPPGVRSEYTKSI
jgi:hypothetical protein